MPKSWYRIEAASRSSEADVFLYDEIGGWGIPADQFVKDFAKLTAKTIHIRINSPGGSVFDGLAIYQAIKRHASSTVAHIDGIAASIASIIALGAKRVQMAKGASYMIHDPWVMVAGTAEDLRKQADVVEKKSEDLVAIYAGKSGKPEQQIRDWMADETWFGAEEAKDAGFVDEVTDGDAVVASMRPEIMARLRHVPESIRNAVAPPAEAAPGQARPQSPGASGTRVVKLNAKPKEATVTIKEQIGALEAKRQADAAAMEALTVEAAKRGETFSEEEEQKFDDLKAEIEASDKHLDRLRDMDRLNVQAAKPVEQPAATRKVAPVTVKANVEKGITFARYAKALVLAGGNKFEAANYAERTWGDQPEIAKTLRASATAAGDTATTAWATELAQPSMLNDFMELLRPATLLGKIPGLRRVPFNVSMPTQTGGGTYTWLGEGKPATVTKAAFDTVSLGIAKAAGIIVLTEELVRNSSPSAEGLIRDEMVRGMAKYLDEQFIVATNAAVSNVSPGAVTNGVTGTAASGTAESNARADIRKLISNLAGNNYPLGEVVLVTSEAIAFVLGTLVNSLGQTAFPGVSVNGGSILGIPLVTSNSVGTQIVALHAPSILFADSGIELDISREATIQMDTAPTDPVVDATVLTSLWQHGLVGLRAIHFINWVKGRSTCVDRYHTVAYA